MMKLYCLDISKILHCISGKLKLYFTKYNHKISHFLEILEDVFYSFLVSLTWVAVESRNDTQPHDSYLNMAYIKLPNVEDYGRMS